MKKFFFIVSVFACLNAASINAQDAAKVYDVPVSAARDVRANADSIGASLSNGKHIWLTANGAAFTIEVSGKTGKEYRKYLGAELSAQICKDFGREYKVKPRK